MGTGCSFEAHIQEIMIKLSSIASPYFTTKFEVVTNIWDWSGNFALVCLLLKRIGIVRVVTTVKIYAKNYHDRSLEKCKAR